MMKKAILMVVFGCLAMMLLASVGIATVKMEDHYSAVCRVVINLTGDAQYNISESGGELAISFTDFDDGSKARIYMASSELITAIEQDDEVLRFAIGKPYRYETMNFEYPRRLVLDVFLSSPNRAQRLVIADFYSEMGKYASADKAYSALHASYPRDAQILYHWALLLTKRHSSRATEKLAQIPETSQYYERGQKLLARLSGDSIPVPPPPKEELPAPPMETSTPEAITPQDSIIIPAPVRVPEEEEAVPPVPKPVIKNAKNPFKLQLALLIGLLALLAVVLYFLFTGKKQPKIDLLADDFPAPGEEEASDRTMRRMVTKLLDDGWTNKEIARELKISTTKVENLIRFRRVDSQKENEN